MIDKKNTLILVALEQELPKSYLPGWKIIYTGVGKVNTSFAISRSYLDYKPEYVVNYGTAGSLNKNISGLIEVSKFYQRDMDVRGLGFQLGQTPFENDFFVQLNKNGYSCGTGDSFVMGPDPWFNTADIDCVDMEGWALAYVAQQYGIPFRSWKYINTYYFVFWVFF